MGFDKEQLKNEISRVKRKALPFLKNIPMHVRKGKEILHTGDIFKVPLTSSIGYFQFIYKDNDYMAGHLIRAFSFRAKIGEAPDPVTITQSGTQFFTYTRVFEGISLGLWSKKGQVSLESSFELPLFRATPDCYANVKKSDKWYLWSGDWENKVVVGLLPDDLRSVDISGIIPPKAVVRRLETGWNGFMSPE